MVELYTYFYEMNGLYEEFDQHSETLETHHDHIRTTSMTFEQVTSWQKHIKENLHDVVILESLQAKMTEVTIDTWEVIYDSIETLINEAKNYCE